MYIHNQKPYKKKKKTKQKIREERDAIFFSGGKFWVLVANLAYADFFFFFWGGFLVAVDSPRDRTPHKKKFD